MLVNSFIEQTMLVVINLYIKKKKKLDEDSLHCTLGGGIHLVHSIC